MARLRSPQKRQAILDAAALEIDATGLGASTARIAKRAAVAEGTLFTYFANKETLLNELYLDIKIELYRLLNSGPSANGTLKERTRHIWTTFLDLAIEFPEKRKVSLQLNMSDLITPETRERVASYSGTVAQTLTELGQQGASRGLPISFASSVLAAMQEVATDFIARQPADRQRLSDLAFEAFWKAVD